MEDTGARVTRLLRERNYVGAYSVVRAMSNPDDRAEYAGLVAEALAQELSTPRLARERAVYIRSLLVWVFRDFPGLSALYREQLRIAAGRSTGFDVLEGVRNIQDIATGRKTFEEGVGDTVESVRQGVESNEGVREFFDRAGENVKDAIDQFGRMFRVMSGDETGGADRGDQSPQTNAPADGADDETEDPIRVEIVNDDE